MGVGPLFKLHRLGKQIKKVSFSFSFSEEELLFLYKIWVQSEMRFCCSAGLPSIFVGSLIGSSLAIAISISYLLFYKKGGFFLYLNNFSAFIETCIHTQSLDLTTPFGFLH